MGRLINADKLNFSEQHYNKSQTKAILDFVDAQPTAYDPDKVVKQLEKKRADALNMLRQNKGTLLEYVFKSEYDIWNEAVEIVKGGGVDA